LIAILPYKIEGIAATASSARRGELVSLSANIKASGKLGRHIFHIEVTDPKGNLVRYYTRNVVAPNGRWEGTLPTALNAPTGTWRVKIREVVSDLETTARFTLQ